MSVYFYAILQLICLLVSLRTSPYRPSIVLVSDGLLILAEVQYCDVANITNKVRVFLFLINLTTNNMSRHIEPVAAVAMRYWQGVQDIYN